MSAQPVMFLVMSFCNMFSLNVAERCVGRPFERNYNSSLVVNVPGEKVRSLLDCGDLCFGSSFCKAFCYSQITDLCYLSQASVSNGQIDVGLGSQCYDTIGCSKTKGYTWYGDRCIQGYMEAKNYTDARAICTQDGGHLYHLKTLESDLQPIVDLAAADVTLGLALWMGADDLEVDGQFKWSDFSLLADDSSVWRAGQPIGADQHCVMLSQTDFRLHDFTCSTTRMFVCEIDI